MTHIFSYILTLSVCIVAYTNSFAQDADSSIVVTQVDIQLRDSKGMHALCISPDGQWLFVSKRTSSGEKIEALKYEDGKWNEFGELTPPTTLKSINSVTLTKENTMYGTCMTEDMAQGDMDIYPLRLTDKGIELGSLSDVSEINTGKWEAQPSISADGKLLFFASNRKSSTAIDIDIYVSEKKPDGTWSRAVSLGPKINHTPYDACPFIASDNETLYFVSNPDHHLKRLIVYMSQHMGPSWTDWSDPVPLPEPINSESVTLFPAMPLKGNTFFFLAGKAGNLSLYQATITAPNKYFPTIK